jgi:hypothetical protein
MLDGQMQNSESATNSQGGGSQAQQLTLRDEFTTSLYPFQIWLRRE